jgi:hypothetical protein
MGKKKLIFRRTFFSKKSTTKYKKSAELIYNKKKKIEKDIEGKRSRFFIKKKDVKPLDISSSFN